MTKTKSLKPGGAIPLGKGKQHKEGMHGGSMRKKHGEKSMNSCASKGKKY